MSRDLILVAFSLMIWGTGEGMFLYFQSLYLQQLGADSVLIGTIIGMTGIAMTVAHLPAGYLADRVGRKPLMLAAWYLATLSTWIMALSGSLPGFVLGSILYGLTAFVVGPMNSYITAARGRISVGRALTLISAIYNIGAILGALLGGWIGNRWGLQRNFLIAAVIFIPSSLLITLIRSQPVEAHSVEKHDQNRAVLLNHSFLAFLALNFLVMFVIYLPQPLTTNFLQNERGVNLGQIGILISLRSAGIVALSLGLGQLHARLSYLLSQLALGLFSLLIWKGNSMAGYALAYLLIGGFVTARSMASAQGRSLVNAANMGMAYGMIETTGALTVILAPPLAGYLYSIQPELVYIVSLIGIGIMFIFSWLFLPHTNKGR
jgi:hypothetical protein